VLELVTRRQPGVFSPLISKLEWAPEPWEIAAYAFPGYSLYLGPNIENLLFGIHTNEPTHLASLRYVLNRLPTLKTIEIKDKSYSAMKGVPFVHQCGYLTSLPWEHLESITITSVPAIAIPHLSSLPNLTAICLHDPEIPPLYTRDGLGDETPFLSNGRRFRSLRSVEIHTSSSFTEAIGFLQHLHPTNQVRSIGVWSSCSDENVPFFYATNARLLLDTIHHHLNPDTLRMLEICHLTEEYFEIVDTLELYSCDVDISPMLKFANLETVEIRLEYGVWLTPALAKLIPTSWPKIESLYLRSYLEEFPVPCIDHTHILSIAHGCRSLRTLRLCFNAEQVAAEDGRDSAAQRASRGRDGERGPRSRLKTLVVGPCSPIGSSSSVTSFLVAHFPDLECLGCESSENLEPGKHTELWEEVRQAIRERNGA
jgi:hypothetical protein